jgi:UDP-glucuronate 4-epimerase
MHILVTGSCGFIGFSLSKKLLENRKNNIVGLDNINDYYDISLKKNRLKVLKAYKNFKFYNKDLNSDLTKIFNSKRFDCIINLAAQPGVRNSFLYPKKYFNNNIKAFFNLLEYSKKFKVKKIITASSSSVYGDTKNIPSKEINKLKPENFYALTKCSNEQISKFYSNIFNLNIISLRFFTVFGPYGRPDMLIFKLCENLFFDKKINIHNRGNHKRDFTYIDDAVAMVIKLVKDKKLKRYHVFNICNSKPVSIKNILKIFNNYKKLSNINYIPFQKGEVKDTYGSNKKFEKYFKKSKKTEIENAIKLTINWFKSYYKIKK